MGFPRKREREREKGVGMGREGGRKEAERQTERGG